MNVALFGRLWTELMPSFSRCEHLAADSVVHRLPTRTHAQNPADEGDERHEAVKELQQAFMIYDSKQVALEATMQDLRRYVMLEFEQLRAQISAKDICCSGSLSPGTEEGTSEKQPSRFTSAENSTDLELHHLASYDGTGATVDLWKFQNSCWDAAAFIGNSDLLMVMESLAIIFLLLVNIAMQGGFVAIVWLSLGGSSLDDETLQGYHWWRTNIGHSVQFMEPLTLESLASRVCRADASLHLSETQSRQVADIRSYLDDHAPFNGALMCVLALTTWILTVCKDFHLLIDMFIALACVPRGRTLVGLATDKRLKLHSISVCRLLHVCCLGVVRGLIAALLLIAGVRYLISTLSLEDILLNAVALEFILNVDELLYEALAPLKTRRLITLLQPIPVARARSCGGVDVGHIFWVAHPPILRFVFHLV